MSMGARTDGVGRLVTALRAVNQDDRPGTQVRLAEVQRAGGGALRLTCGGLPVEKDELYVNPTLNYAWTRDTGGTDLLRSGDLVVLLTPAGSEADQEYYLVCKAVRA